MLTGLAAPAMAHEAAIPSVHETAAPALLPGSRDVWSVSRSDAGCYLMSPRRTDGSSLMIGRHPKFGAGLFIMNFGLSVSRANIGEPVVIQAEGGDLGRVGRMIGARLLFVPLGAADIADSLRTLKDAGVLGLVIRQTWMGHGGRHVAEAVVQYGEADCTRAGLADLKSGK